MERSEEIKKLETIAVKIRMNVIEGIFNAKSGHPGGSLSIADILSVLYFKEMNIDEKKPLWKDRDRFVLSKGHTAPAYYAALALRGYFGVETIRTLRQINSPLQGHPDMNKVKGVDMSTGSLGQGLSVANGMALYAKRKNKAFRVYAVLGDGEIQEGQIWEAAMSAAHYSLDNLIVLLDNNNLQIDGSVDKVMSVYPIKEKFQAFGWSTLEIDGHNIAEIISALEAAKKIKDKPVMIICKTVKGKGAALMENKAEWHGAAPNQQQYEEIMDELKKRLEELGGK
ncbi:MAG: transketolase [Clostridia bacterium BRH_c25]|nr:MAG: transketolase [Clostridia bacterium BRH_c25]